jgi:uncharacterized protein (DUF1330 family)
MSAYVVVQVTVTEPEKYDEYKTQVAPTIEAHGGRYLVRGGATETLEGDWDPGRLVILEFPTVEQAKAWWASEEYRQPKALRHAAATSMVLVVQGL